MSIRLATPMDLVDVAQCIAQMREETIWKMIPLTLNLQHIEYWLVRALVQPQHRLWVAEHEGHLVGLCGVELTTQRFIPDVPYVQEWALWVAPLHRGNGVAKQLWRTACRWGARVGARGSVRGKPTAHGERMVFCYWGEAPCWH
jgi:GNAT superfamily N-acetyltransferase